MSKDVCGVLGLDANQGDEYRRFAQTCLKMALDTKDQATRSMFLSMAQAWNNLADRNLAASVKVAIEDFNRRQLDT